MEHKFLSARWLGWKMRNGCEDEGVPWGVLVLMEPFCTLIMVVVAQINACGMGKIQITSVNCTNIKLVVDVVLQTRDIIIWGNLIKTPWNFSVLSTSCTSTVIKKIPTLFSNSNFSVWTSTGFPTYTLFPEISLLPHPRILMKAVMFNLCHSKSW